MAVANNKYCGMLFILYLDVIVSTTASEKLNTILPTINIIIPIK